MVAVIIFMSLRFSKLFEDNATTNVTFDKIKFGIENT